MSRISNVIKNAKVGVFFLILTFAASMYSRKIFLDGLGGDFVGLTTTLLSIIGLISLAEMGMAVAISSTLYKPLANKDFGVVSEILSFLKGAYLRIALFILIVSLIVSLSFPFFFSEETISLELIYFIFFTLLGSVLIEYVVNYKKLLFIADQKMFKVTKYYQSINLIKIFTQIIVVIEYQSPVLWGAIALIFSVVSSFLINFKVEQSYPALNTSKLSFTELYKRNTHIVVKVKYLIVHKASDFVFRTSDSLFCYYFTTLLTVAIVGNYQLLSGAIRTLVGTVSESITASVGSFVSEKSVNESHTLFHTIFSFQWFAATFIAINFSILSNHLVKIWLGGEYVVDSWILIMISLNTFVVLVRGPIDNFINAYGLFQDIRAPIVELTINLIISILFGYIWGIPGVLLGTFVSISLVVLGWKPYFIYKEIFLENYSFYIRSTLIRLLSTSISCILSFYLISFAPSDVSDLYEWVILASISVIITSLVCLSVYVILDKHFRTFFFKITRIKA